MIKLNPFLRRVFKTYGEPASKKYNMPLFVTGCPRSGTTLLVDKLSSHPQLLKIGVELNDAWTKIGGASIKGHCDYKNATDASGYYTYQMTNYFSDFIHESKTLKRHLMRANSRLNYKTGRVFYDWPNIIPVNKSPHLMNKIGYVRSLFPQSKFIIIIRDIYGHSASMKHHFLKLHRTKSLLYYVPNEKHACWSNTSNKNTITGVKYYPENFELIPEMWFKLNILALETVKTLAEEQVLIVSYENLVNDQENTIKRIFQFLKLDEKHEHHIEKIAKSKVNIINATTKGEPLEKWKKQLTTEEKESVKRTISKNMEYYKIIGEAISI